MKLFQFGSGTRRLACWFTLVVALFGWQLLVRQSPAKAIAAARTAASATVEAETQKQWSRTYGKLPLRFEANQGQAAAPVKFLARGSGYTLTLAPDEMVWHLRQPARATSLQTPHPAALRMKLLGALPAPRVSGLEQLETRSNYLLGNDPRGWQTNLANFARVKYETVYPGIDLVFYGTERQLEYDFVVAPGADVRRIKLSFAGAQRLRLARNGDLLLRVPGGALRQRKPVAYQLINGQRKQIAARYVVRQRVVRFQLGKYDRRQPLWIDPVLSYSTLFGGSGGDEGLSIAVDGNGNAYIVGATSSTDLLGASQSPLQNKPNGFVDAFVAKLNADGSALSYVTYLGGKLNEFAYGVAVDEAGNAFLTGTTNSPDFPLRNALQSTLKGVSDGFVAKLSADGTRLIYATYLGGSNDENSCAITTDAAGNAYIAGNSTSADYPVVNAAQNALRSRSFFVSTDGGSTWTARALPRGGDLRKLVFDPHNPAILYAALETSIFKSTDHGLTWNATGINPPAQITDFVIDPGDPQYLYIGTFNGLYRSVNGGATIAPVAGSIARSITSLLAVAPLSATLYAASGNSLYKSNSRGEFWNSVTGFGFSNSPTTAVVIDPTQITTIYAAQVGVWKSLNEGLSWSFPFFQYQMYDLAIERVNPQTLYGIMLFSPNGNLIKTTNGGGQWLGLDFPSNVAPARVFTDPERSGVVYVTTRSHGLYKSTDGGTTWAAINTGLATLPISTLAFEPANSTNLYAGTIGSADAIVSKLSADGSTLLYSTYLGGDGGDTALSLAVDAAGSAYVAGSTESLNFPIVPSNPGGTVVQPRLGGGVDGFVAKLNPTGNVLSFSSYFGGSARDTVNDLAVDNAGRIYLAGTTSSTDFPRVRPLPGGQELRGFVDGFVARINANGTAFDYSTYLGGNARDEVRSIALDAAGNAHVCGVTASTDFPLANALQTKNGQGSSGDDAFYSKLRPDGTQLLVSTYLGGSISDQGRGIALDTSNNVYLTGVTTSADFPTHNPLRTQPAETEAFIVKLGQQADLALTIATTINPVLVNNHLTYTLTVTNNGPDDALDVRFSDSLPSGLQDVQASTSQGTCSGTSTVSCNLGTLLSQSTATVTIRVTPTTVGILRNTATVTSSTPEKDPANNTASNETRVSDKPSIYGSVTLTNNVGVASVTMALSGSATLAQLTNGQGAYQFADLALGGNYTLVPQLTGYVIRPTTRSFNELRQDQRADFSATQCVYTLTPINRFFSKAGGTGSVAVSTNDALCPWTARSNVPWIQITSSTSGSGNGTVNFTVAPTATGRSGTLVIGERVFTVVQEADACGTASFTTPRVFDVLFSQSAFSVPRIYAGDLNNDGQSDLALLSSTPALVQVMLNAGNGVFPTRRDVLLGFNSVFDPGGVSDLVIGDVNRDGKADLVATGYDSRGGLAVTLLGNGDGTFGEARFLVTGEQPAAVLLEDFNRDNHVDLALTLIGGTLAVALGNGDGTFRAVAKFGGSLITGGHTLVTGLFNNDAHLDVAVAGSNAVGVLLGDGTGKFTLDQSKLLQPAHGPRTLAAADFNRDGKTDLVITQNRFPALEKEVSIYQSKGDGTFEAARDFSVAVLPRQTLAGDFNGDGYADVLTANYGTGDVSLLTGQGNGNFNPARHYYSGGQAVTLARGDFNGDQRPDVVVYVYENLAGYRSVKLALLLNSVNGFTAAPDLLLDFLPRWGVTGDFNNDGRPDVALTGASGNTVATLLGNANNSFAAPILTNTSAAFTLVEARDFNRDGKLDLLAQVDGKGTVLFGNGQGGFPLTTNTPFVLASSSAAAFGDFNNDGSLDAVGLDGNGKPGLYLGNGTGGLTLAVNFGLGFDLQRLTAGDFNGDGFLDVAAATPNNQSCNTGGGSFWLFFGNGRGALSAGVRVTTDVAVFDLSAEDLNSDGRADLAVVISCAEQGRLAVLLSNPAGGFFKPEFYQAAFHFTSVKELRFVDLNGDGLSDLLVRYNLAGQEGISFWLNQGAGHFGAPNDLNGLSAFLFLPGDFNGDGKTDFILSNGGASATIAGALTLLYNTCLPSGALANVSAASYSNARFAPESIVAAFGNALATQTRAASTQPLPTTLAGTTVNVTDASGVERLAPLFFVAPTQVNYLLPTGTAPGAALVTVTNGGGAVSTATLMVANIAPALFSADASGQGPAAAVILRIKAGGTQSFEPVAEFNPVLNRFVTRPIDLGPDLGAASDQVFLLLFGTGIRGRDTQQGQISATLGSRYLPVEFAGAQGTLTGVDQVNVRLPRTLIGQGEIEATLFVDQLASNKVRLNIR